MISKLKGIIKKYILPYRPLLKDPKIWDNQFEDGSWDYLDEIYQLARYSVIVGYFKYFIKFSGSILDLGCGQGILHKRFAGENYSKYVGIDISEKAIIRAKLNIDQKSSFICQDLQKYEPDQMYDLIVFNESLYYFEKPLELLNKYKNYLNPDGKIIISMWDNPERNNKLWIPITENFKIWDEIKLQGNKDKARWIIKVIS